MQITFLYGWRFFLILMHTQAWVVMHLIIRTLLFLKLNQEFSLLTHHLVPVNLVMVLRDGRQVSFGEKSQVLKNNVTQVNPSQGKKVYARSSAPAVSAV